MNDLFQCKDCRRDAVLKCEGINCRAMMCVEHSKDYRHQLLCLDCYSDQREMEADLEADRILDKNRGFIVTEDGPDFLHCLPTDKTRLDWCGHPECQAWGSHLCREEF